MRHSRLIGPIAAMAALMSCGQPAGDASAAVGQNSRGAAAAAQGHAGNAASANGLWGVAEAEDEASHRGLDFIAFNRSGRTIIALSIRPVEGPLAAGAPETPWSANILTQRELPDAQRAAAHYEADIELCTWQVRATFADRQTRDYPAVNMCETIRVDLR
jgi:hypothetical protein